MSGKSGTLPESLELLLDTMCNTFGGIMFIAISLIIISSLVSKVQMEMTPEEIDRKRIEALNREIGQVNERIAVMRRQLNEVRYDDAGAAAGKKAVLERLKQIRQESVSLENQQDQLARKNRLARREKKIQEEKCRTLSIAFVRKKTETAEKSGQMRERIAELAALIRKLTKETADFVPKTIRFSMERKTTLSPYWVLLENQSVYRFGTADHSVVEEVTGKELLEKRALLLIPNKGTMLGEEPVAELDYMFRNVDSSRYFISLMAHPESFSSLITVKQYLREKGYLVRWSIASQYLLVRSDNVTYKASQ